MFTEIEKAVIHHYGNWSFRDGMVLYQHKTKPTSYQGCKEGQNDHEYKFLCNKEQFESARKRLKDVSYNSEKRDCSFEDWLKYVSRGLHDTEKLLNQLEKQLKGECAEERVNYPMDNKQLQSAIVRTVQQLQGGSDVFGGRKQSLDQQTITILRKHLERLLDVEYMRANQIVIEPDNNESHSS